MRGCSNEGEVWASMSKRGMEGSCRIASSGGAAEWKHRLEHPRAAHALGSKDLPGCSIGWAGMQGCISREGLGGEGPGTARKGSISQSVEALIQSTFLHLVRTLLRPTCSSTTTT